MNITEESILHRFIEQRRGFLLFSAPKKPGEEEFFASLQYLRNPLTKSGPDPGYMTKKSVASIHMTEMSVRSKTRQIIWQED